MCFNETVSWVTLFGGLTLNAVGYLLLRSRYHTRNDPAPRAIVLSFCYFLLIQLPEAMVWRNNSSEGWGRVAHTLNVAQPHVYYVAGCWMLWTSPSRMRGLHRARQFVMVLATISLFVYLSSRSKKILLVDDSHSHVVVKHDARKLEMRVASICSMSGRVLGHSFDLTRGTRSATP